MNSYDANDDEGFEDNDFINAPFSDEVLKATFHFKNN